MGVFVLLISLVLLGGAFIALNIKVGHDSDTPFTVNIDASQPQGKNE